MDEAKLRTEAGSGDTIPGRKLIKDGSYWEAIIQVHTILRHILGQVLWQYICLVNGILKIPDHGIG